MPHSIAICINIQTRMNHGIHYVSVVERLSCLPLHTPRSFAQQRSMPKCTIIVSQLVALYPIFFSVFFSLDATLKCILLAAIRSCFGQRPRNYTIIDFWSGLDNPSDLDLVTAHYYITFDFWSGLAQPSDAKSSVISQMSLPQYFTFGV